MRRIINAFVKRLALCKRGKNGMQTLFKSSNGNFELTTLVKGDPEKGELLAVMWPKGIADEDGDFSDTDKAIKSMTSSLIQNGGALDIEHDGKVLSPEAAYISEVFTIQKSDPRFEGWEDYDGNVVDVTGGAAVQIQINDPDLRAAYRNGDWDGVSLFGPAAVEHVDIAAASKRVAERMRGVQENEMNKEELQALLKAQAEQTVELVKSAVESIVESLKPKATKTTEGGDEGGDEGKDDLTKAEKQPTFTGSVSDPKALETYENELRGFELRKAIASGKMSSKDIAEMRKSMAESPITLEEFKEANIEAKADDSEEVRELQTKLFKAQKGSNAPQTVAGSTSEEDELAKASADEGAEIAKLMNQNLGNSPMVVHTNG